MDNQGAIKNTQEQSPERGSLLVSGHRNPSPFDRVLDFFAGVGVDVRRVPDFDKHITDLDSTLSHQERVASLSDRIARRLPRGSLTERDRSILFCAASCHDLGKVDVGLDLLFSSERLIGDQRAAIEGHAAASEQLLRRPWLDFYNALILQENKRHRLGFVPFTRYDEAAVRSIALAARGHHERFDGTGYPDGLAGKAIPLASRIIAVADVYDALRQPRSYKPGQGNVQTLWQMAGLSGTAFDPQVLGALMALKAPREPVRPGARALAPAFMAPRQGA